MKRVLAIMLAMGAAVALFTGCNSGSSTKQPSAEDVVKAVSAELTFKDNMTMVAADRIPNFYRIDMEQVDSLAVYMSGSGATAEEIAVIKVKDPANIQLAEDAMTERVENQKQSFEGYKPEEMPKLDAAVVYAKGNYAVLAVVDDIANVKKTFDAQF